MVFEVTVQIHKAFLCMTGFIIIVRVDYVQFAITIYDKVRDSSLMLRFDIVYCLHNITLVLLTNGRLCKLQVTHPRQEVSHYLFHLV
jgi:hypothetical protein